jgi:DegV family protein with EDD domain
MTIRIVTDSTCDLPEELLQKYDITVIPLYINIGEKGYLDRIEISRQEFYNGLPNFDVHPTTAAPGVDMFRGVYEQLAEEGASEILSIHISESLSATINVARSAAEETDVIPVTVIDSQQLSTGTGFIVLDAAKAAKEGHSRDEIMAIIEDMIPRAHVIAAVDTLEFLRRSGRMNGWIAGIGSILQVKPLLRMNKGQPVSDKVRTRKAAFKRLIVWLEEMGPVEKVAMVHSNATDLARELYEQAKHLFPHVQSPMYLDVTPVLGAHLGPNTVGFAVITANE